MNQPKTGRRIIVPALVLLIIVLSASAFSSVTNTPVLPASPPNPVSAPGAATAERAAPQQKAPIPNRIEPYVVRSGLHKGLAQSEASVAFRNIVSIKDAPWLRVHFGAVNLGGKSQITITSLEDGAQQVVDAVSLKDWGHKSAFFNGDAVSIELSVAADDSGIFYEIAEVMVGEWGADQLAESVPSANIAPESVCGTTDDRVASSDNAVGRIVPTGCTGWIISNGAFLTAGHCNDGTMATIEFNVPASASDGTIRHPGPEDQYPIVGTIVSNDGGSGQDWAVFAVGRSAPPAPGVPQLPVHRQGAFYRTSIDLNPVNATVTGYGLDGPGPCFGDPRQPGCIVTTWNADNQTQQTHSGRSEGLTGTHWQYEVDTQGGNSGGPIVDTLTGVTVGVHTHGAGGVACPGGPAPTPQAFNGGTAFANTALETAIAEFPREFVGQDVVYVDRDHPSPQASGSVFRPFKSVTAGVNDVQARGIVSIVKGTYAEVLTINSEMTLKAPAGLVTIGQ